MDAKFSRYSMIVVRSLWIVKHITDGWWWLKKSNFKSVPDAKEYFGLICFLRSKGNFLFPKLGGSVYRQTPPCCMTGWILTRPVARHEPTRANLVLPWTRLGLPMQVPTTAKKLRRICGIVRVQGVNYACNVALFRKQTQTNCFLFS
jgi:hypothetical protein